MAYDIEKLLKEMTFEELKEFTAKAEERLQKVKSEEINQLKTTAIDALIELAQLEPETFFYPVEVTDREGYALTDDAELSIIDIVEMIKMIC